MRVRGRIILCLLGLAAAFFGCTDYVALLTSEICDPTPNGCGPQGPLAGLLLDCPLGLICFTEACDVHDVCYRTCGVSRAECDDEFSRNLTSICTESFTSRDPRSTWCRKLAYIYWQTAVRFGGAAFQRLQQRACACQGRNHESASKVESEGGQLVNAPPFLDRDDDLLPDDWETLVGLDPVNPNDTLLDPDMDGFLNLQEFISDRDPFEPDQSGAGGWPTSSEPGDSSGWPVSSEVGDSIGTPDRGRVPPLIPCDPPLPAGPPLRTCLASPLAKGGFRGVDAKLGTDDAPGKALTPH